MDRSKVVITLDVTESDDGETLFGTFKAEHKTKKKSKKS